MNWIGLGRGWDLGVWGQGLTIEIGLDWFTPAVHVLGEGQVAPPDLHWVQDVYVGIVDLLPLYEALGRHHPHPELWALPGPSHYDAPEMSLKCIVLDKEVLHLEMEG